MPGRVIRYLDKVLELEGESGREQALIEERYHALQRHVPWLYAILLTNLFGLNVSLASPKDPLLNVGNFLGLLAAGRLVYWLSLRGRSQAAPRMKAQMRKAFILAGMFCAAYCWWSLSLYYEGTGDRIHVVLFASMAALGCSFGLSVLPAAGRLPLLLLALPMALQLLTDGNLAHAGMGISLIMLIFLTVRLNGAHNESFAKLVYARFDVERERERATAAERVANAEKSRVRQIADTDALTGIANRRAFLRSVEQLGRTGSSNLAVALIDLDGFKPINDTFGHETGDQLLIDVSRRLCASIDREGTVARLGGDEFALLFPCDDPAVARAVCERAAGLLGRPFEIAHRTLSISTCIGISFHGPGQTDVQQSLRQADIALYRAKRAGKGRVKLFSSEMEADLQRRTSIEQALRDPTVQGSIDLAFQPIVDLQTMELQSFEALARWRHSELGWIAPSEFIPITEHISVVERISDSLLARAAEQACRWPERVRLSFNLSAVELCSSASAGKIVGIVEAAGMPASRLQIEVTETALLADFELARRNLAFLRDQGVNVLLDDFGAGYASISYLREIEFDAVKLDGSIITRAAGGEGLPLLKGVLRLCESMSLPCVAEHVESEAELLMLQALRCRYGQGFGLARPMDGEAAARFVRDRSTEVKPRAKKAAA